MTVISETSVFMTGHLQSRKYLAFIMDYLTAQEAAQDLMHPIVRTEELWNLPSREEVLI